MSPFDARSAGANSASVAAGTGPLDQNPLPFSVPGQEAIRVAIVDDEEPERLLLQDILSGSGEFQCAGAYASGEEALREIPTSRPQIVLMDVRMPGISGIDCMRVLKGIIPGLIVVLVSGLVDEQTVSDALEAGGDGYLMKPFVIAQFLAVLRFTVRNRRSGDTEASFLKVTGLTERETEVMNCIAKGMLYKEIEEELHLSSPVLKKIQHRIFSKLQVGNRTEAVIRWLKGIR